MRSWLLKCVLTASGFSPYAVSRFALRNFFSRAMGFRLIPRLNLRRWRALNSSMRSWLLKSKSLSKSMPRYEYFRKVRFLGSSSAIAAPGGEEREPLHYREESNERDGRRCAG